MITELMPTQIEDIEKIAATTDLPNFSEPGTGKTLTTIGAIERMKLHSGVIICPTVATTMWMRLLNKELGADAQWLKTRKTKVDRNADFWIMSYGVAEAHYDELKGRPDNGVLVIDESHYIKSPDALRTQVIMGEHCDGNDGYYFQSEQCFLLTGTPIERYADDLWSQLRATQPQALHQYGALSLDEFRRQFTRMAYKTYGNEDRKITKLVSVDNQNEKLLNRMLYKDIGCIRRTMDEVDPFMPPTTERAVYVQMKESKELKELLKGLSLQEVIRRMLEGDGHIATARRLTGLGKVHDVVNYVKESAMQGPVLVGYWHTEVGEQIYMELCRDNFAANLISGSTSPSARERIRGRFMDGSLDVLIGQIQAMGVAMDGLQDAGHHVIIAEPDWSASKMEQFYKRIARKGQRQHTQVDYCLSDTVIDEAIMEIATKKAIGMRLVHER